MDLSVERRHITIGRRTLSYLVAGIPPCDRVVVFLHAFPLNANMWMPQLRALPDGWVAVAPDFRGFGASSPDDAGLRWGEARLEDYAADVAALLDAIGSERAALCGCSMGGYAALAILRRVPVRVSGLLLADTRATADSAAAKAARQDMLGLLEREGPGGVAADMRSKLVGPTTRSERPDVTAEVDGMMAQATAAGIGCAVWRIMNRPDGTADLQSFRGPVTVVVGEEDALTPPAEAADMARAAAWSSFVTVSRAGHLSNLEAPAAFNVALGAWLGRLAAADR